MSLAADSAMRGHSTHTIWAGLRLAWMLAKRDLRNRYAASYAGAAWNIGVPLLYALINVIVFSVLMNGRMGVRYDNLPFALFYFLPFSLWTVFAEVLGRSTSILRQYQYLINRIAFPQWTLPLVPLASALLCQAIVFVLIAGLIVQSHVPLAASAWVFLPLWLIALAFTLGLAYAVAALAVYVPDLAQVVPVCITVLFWLTPILYPASLVEQHGAWWVRTLMVDCNPFYYLVESARHAVFGDGSTAWPAIGAMACVGAAVFAAGLAVFRKLQPGFADVI
ncbi:MAG TPA: ABC transporter permease [Burkholderiaceae bacterium]